MHPLARSVQYLVLCTSSEARLLIYSCAFERTAPRSAQIPLHSSRRRWKASGQLPTIRQVHGPRQRGRSLQTSEPGTTPAARAVGLSGEPAPKSSTVRQP